MITTADSLRCPTSMPGKRLLLKSSVASSKEETESEPELKELRGRFLFFSICVSYSPGPSLPELPIKIVVS